ncbi:MAG: hypothetical protein QNI99_17585 [Woeseiaceae bacterium]|nr:hypothetical protein [Woeseiaceae bacterium]
MKRINAGLALTASLLAACGGSGSGGGQQPVNVAPTISPIADTDTVANAASQPIIFSLTDEDVSSVAISVSSDRPGVVPNDAISVSGTGAVRRLEIVPVVDTTGDAMITVIVQDTEGLGASSSFLLTVVAEQQSMSQFTRDMFLGAADGEPALINAVEFEQDADEDDFADLLAQ